MGGNMWQKHIYQNCWKVNCEWSHSAKYIYRCQSKNGFCWKKKWLAESQWIFNKAICRVETIEIGLEWFPLISYSPEYMKAVHLPRTEIDHQTTAEERDVFTWECVREGRSDSFPPPNTAMSHCWPVLQSSLFYFSPLSFCILGYLFFHDTWSWFCSFPSQSVMSSLLREEMQRVLFRPGKQRLVEFIEIKEPAQGRHFLCVSGKWLFLWLINI